MGVFKLSVLTIGVIGVSMLHFGRDEGLPDDRIGREPTIDPATIVPVSASGDLAVDNSAVIAEGEVISTANALAIASETNADVTTPTPRALRVIKVASVSEVNDTAPQNAAEKAETAARLMAANSLEQAKTEIRTTEETAQEMLYVSGSTVNMRAGPSTRHGVVARLSRGTAVIDMGPAGNGWNQIKVADTGKRGFMSSRFLTPQL